MSHPILSQSDTPRDRRPVSVSHGSWGSMVHARGMDRSPRSGRDGTDRPSTCRTTRAAGPRVRHDTLTSARHTRRVSSHIVLYDDRCASQMPGDVCLSAALCAALTHSVTHAQSSPCTAACRWLVAPRRAGGTIFPCRTTRARYPRQRGSSPPCAQRASSVAPPAMRAARHRDARE